jgi:hypothetical protein
MKPALQQIHDIAKAVADGYAAEQSMGDDGLYNAVVDLGDHAKFVMQMAAALDQILTMTEGGNPFITKSEVHDVAERPLL